jgi:hypothetical protein
MKRFTPFLIILILLSATVNAQIKFGVRGGLSSSQVRIDKEIDLTSIEGTTIDELNIKDKNPKLGFHAGGFMQVTIGTVYLQPELLFVVTGGEVEITRIANGQVTGTEIASQRFNRIDVPIIGGLKLGPARLGLGPVASFNLKSNDQLKKIIENQIEFDTEERFADATWAFQLDAGINIFGTLVLDAKYEFGLSKLGKGVEIDGQNFNFSQRNNQVILSVGYLF